ncbi:GyrI-like domain-containing protein [Embleya sp. NPDC020886]|uniref:GyrI-like domain-containing protein n=1 Tax=Embleya sp. NPDC020886 TaxID=3363980 RepID=UPI0037873AAC
MPRIDFKKTHASLYTASATPTLLRVPELPFLAVDGCGDPAGADYAAAVEALYGLAYTIRFALKGAGIVEYSVPPLQGRWWTDDRGGFDHAVDRAHWHWTMLLMQPAQADEALVCEARVRTAKKKPAAPVDRVQLRRIAEGECAQVLHTGPYDTEHTTLDRLYTFVAAEGREPAGLHHEIYLGNPVRTAPEKLRTILRQPVRPTAGPSRPTGILIG